jgi:hypothetical protein
VRYLLRTISQWPRPIITFFHNDPCVYSALIKALGPQSYVTNSLQIQVHPDYCACEASESHLLEHGASGLRECGSPIEMDDPGEEKKAVTLWGYRGICSWCPSLWRNRLQALTVDQKVWGSIPTRAKAKWGYFLLFSLSILIDKIVLADQSCRVPTPPSTGSLVSV